MTIRIAYATTNRSDYGPVYWLLHDLAHDARFELAVLVGGAHLGAAGTVREIEADGFPIAARVPFDSDDPAAASAAALTGFAAALLRAQPDLLLVYGDRWELLPIANAALLRGVPLGHLCGGDITEGALDDQVRHAVTKLAHLHFPTSARSAARIRQLGEEPWRVHDAGDPSIDRFRRGRAADRDELAQFLGLRPDERTLLVTYHPPTLAPGSLADELAALVEALRAHAGPVVITAPAPDPGHEIVRRELGALAQARPDTVFVESLGSDRYRGLMAIAGAMVGNSSSGLSEAPCVPLPVVNIGERQAGRDRGANVIDVLGDAAAIRAAIARALSPEFRASLAGMASPYGDGHAAERIVSVLAELPPHDRLLRKRFVETSPVTAGPRPIGGDFAFEPPWLYEERTDWFATGRDALAAIARPRTGRWLVPAFMCPIVPETLRAAGASVEPYAWETPWQVDEADLVRKLGGAAGIVVPFHLGLQPAATTWDLFGATLCVVEDRCQCVELPGAPLFSDFAIGSLRKWLPVPDGAWCTTRSGGAPAPTGGAARDMVRLRAAAGFTRAAWLAGGARDATLERAAVELFARGEAAAGDGTAGHHASGFATHARPEHSHPEIVQRRLANQRALASALASCPGVELWEPSPGAIARTDTPLLALPLLCADRDGLRRHLAAQRIFCAVHWADGDWSHSGGRAAGWAARTLSLPIDQRLGSDDIARIAAAITSFSSQRTSP